MIFLVMIKGSITAFVKTNDQRVAEALIDNENYEVISRWRYSYFKICRFIKGA